jgi:Sulfotransferase domain
MPVSNQGSRMGAVRVRARRAAARGTGPLRSLPTYVIIGAQKAGTTSLQHHLTLHPDVFSRDHEIHFLDRYYERGASWYRSWFPLRSTLSRHETRTGRRAATGEKTPEYLFVAGAAERLHGLVPDARLVVALRDPVERAFSQWRGASARGLETLPFPDAVAAEPDAAPPPTPPIRGSALYNQGYIARGRYADRLGPWYEHYPADQIFVYRSEDLYAAPDVWMPRLLEHVGVDPHGLDGIEVPRVNAGPPGQIDPVLRTALVERFRASDERLAELTGLSYYRG